MRIGFVEQCFEKLAIEYLIAVCQRAGAEVELFVDPTLFSDSFYENEFLGQFFESRQRLVKQILEADIELLAFSVVSDDYLWATSIATEVRRHRKIKTVFGGVHPTALPEYVAAHPAVDYVCQGEGEEALIELMECLERGLEPLKVLNLCFYLDGHLIKNPLRNLERDLDSMPFPTKSLYYAKMPIMKNFYMTITSRYCPFRCTFCYNSGMRDLYADKGKYLRQRSPENVIEELTIAKKYHYRYVLFNDDILPFNRKWVREFAPLYQREIGKPFFCYFHPLYADEEIVRLLANAGCVTANMGIQSISPHVRKSMFDRSETQGDIRNAIQTIRRHKVHLNVGHIIGFPGDSEKIEEKGVRFYLKYRPSFIGCYWLRLYPQTKITNTLLQGGNLTAEEIEQINSGEGKSFWLGGSAKNMREVRPFSILFSVLPYFPRSVIRFLLRKKRYRALRWLPFSFITVTSRAAQALANIKDIYGRWGIYLFVGRLRLYFSQRKLITNSSRAARALEVSDRRPREQPYAERLEQNDVAVGPSLVGPNNMVTLVNITRQILKND